MFNGWYTNMPTTKPEANAWDEAENQRRAATKMNDQSSGGGGATGSYPPATGVTGSGGAGAAMAPTTNVNNPSAPRPPSGNAPLTPTQDQARDSTLFDPANPTRALRNALAQAGINANSLNPVASYMMRFAPGLSSLFWLRGASGQEGNLNNASAANIGGLYHDFLSRALSNGGGLAMAYQNMLGGVNNNINAFDAWNNASAENQPVNFFAQQLKDNLAQGGGAAGLMSSLYTPFLGSAAGSFSRGMQNAEDIGWGDPSLYSGNGGHGTILDYLRRVMNL